MAKGMNSQKAAKKEPAKTPKEKKEEKREKRKQAINRWPVFLVLLMRMSTKDPKVFFITPPFTQLNTPYPATAYLKGFLNTQGIAAYQADLGLEVILQLFPPMGLNSCLRTLKILAKI